MAKELTFETSAHFRAWLEENAATSEGVWLLFGKAGGPQTLSAQEALEEALCFGWIDGQMKKLDEQTYRKYFARRRDSSEWSAKNIALVEQLEKAGRIAEPGRAKIDADKTAGRFQPKKRMEITPELIHEFEEKVRGHEPAYTNLMAMSPSVRKNYTGFSLEPKSEETRQKRLEKIIDRLNQNLAPM